jgi:hypothetical protein
MVFYASFNNISAVSWWSVVLVEESVVYRENHRPVASQWQTLSHNVALSTPRHEWDTGTLTKSLRLLATGECSKFYFLWFTIDSDIKG